MRDFEPVEGTDIVVDFEPDNLVFGEEINPLAAKFSELAKKHVDNDLLSGVNTLRFEQEMAVINQQRSQVAALRQRLADVITGQIGTLRSQVDDFRTRLEQAGGDALKTREEERTALDSRFERLGKVWFNFAVKGFAAGHNKVSINQEYQQLSQQSRENGQEDNGLRFWKSFGKGLGLEQDPSKDHVRHIFERTKIREGMPNSANPLRDFAIRVRSAQEDKEISPRVVFFMSAIILLEDQERIESLREYLCQPEVNEQMTVREEDKVTIDYGQFLKAFSTWHSTQG